MADDDIVADGAHTVWDGTRDDYSPAVRGRCVSCGLLGKVPFAIEGGTNKSKIAAPLGRHAEPVEVGPPERRDGQPTIMHVLELGLDLRTTAVCFVGRPTGDEGKTTAETKEAWEEDKKCPDWTPYRIHLNPSWHLNRRDTERSERERRHFELFLAGVTLSLALLAIGVSLAAVPADSWLLCETVKNCR
jgi:hypothetical protein